MPLKEISESLEKAFQQLIAALDEEGAELRKLGAHHFHHDAAPRESRGLLQRAEAFARIRAEVAGCHARWKNGGEALQPAKMPDVNASAKSDEKENPVMFRHLKGMSLTAAAEFLRVTQEQLKEWLGAGLIQGNVSVSGRWKIPRKSLVKFSLEYRDLHIQAMKRI